MMVVVLLCDVEVGVFSFLWCVKAFWCWFVCVFGSVVMKEFGCVHVNHHRKIGKTIADWQAKGWWLHSYQAAGSPTAVSHYLLFEKGE